MHCEVLEEKSEAHLPSLENNNNKKHIKVIPSNNLKSFVSKILIMF